MNLHAIIVLIFAASSLLPPSSLVVVCEAVSEEVGDGDGDGNGNGDGDDDEYYDLMEMTDEELEEICTSRGFELVRDDEVVVYTHQDYVDAASECLQIEADLEEILQKNPEILMDVQRENERMMQERERLLDQLQRQQQNETLTEATATATATGEEEEEEEEEQQQPSNDNTEEEEKKGRGQSHTADTTVVIGAKEEEEKPQPPPPPPSSDNTLDLGVRELLLETMEQMKSDFTRAIDFVLPKKMRERLLPVQMREQIRPALKSCLSIARDMGTTAYDMARRYLMAFVDNNSSRTKEGGGGGSRETPPPANDDETPPPDDEMMDNSVQKGTI